MSDYKSWNEKYNEFVATLKLAHEDLDKVYKKHFDDLLIKGLYDHEALEKEVSAIYDKYGLESKTKGEIKD